MGFNHQTLTIRASKSPQQIRGESYTPLLDVISGILTIVMASYSGGSWSSIPKRTKRSFKQKVGRDAISILSPNGHTVVVLDRTKLHIYMIP